MLRAEALLFAVGITKKMAGLPDEKGNSSQL